MAQNQANKVVVIGLDCAEPSLVFDRYADRLPNLTRLRERGVWGKLRSCDPPITVPAWMSMMSSKDPGTLGYYGFRNRADRSYEKMTTATSLAVKEPLLWDYLGKAGKKVVLLGVPQTYPPRPVNGWMVTDFLTPSIASNYTHPPDLKNEIAGLPDVHPYEFDVSDFRTPDKGKIRDSLIRMTDKRFALARHLMTTKPWDFFMMVEMGTDRVHHAFWQYMDPAHHRHEPGNPFENVIPDYYEHVDARIGELLEVVPDDALVVVVSDHGAQCMDGGIALNEWLVQKGYLVLQEPPTAPSRLEALKVDWRKRPRGARAGITAAYSSRPGERAARVDPSRQVRRDPRQADRRTRSPGRPGGQTDRHPRPQARGAVPEHPRSGAARPVRILRQPPMAVGRDRRHGYDPHLRERHRPR